MNPYLKAKREQYEALRAKSDELMTRASTEQRDLTDAEMTEIRDRGTQMRKLHDEITELTEQENRNAAVGALASTVAPGAGNEPVAPAGPDAGQGGTGDQHRSATTTQDRDPGHYTRSSDHSFFGDLFRAKEYQDQDAGARLVEHNRALSTGVQGQGIVPPKWLTEEFAGVARQGRRVAPRVRNIPLDNPAPLTLPKQTAAVDAAVVEQSAENATTNFPDLYNTGVDTVTPKATVGGAKVSRQMIDMANPAIDQLIYGDLLGAYDMKVEAKVVATILASAGAALTTYATESAFNTATTFTSGKIPLVDAVLNAAIQVRNARKLPADLLLMSVLRYGQVLGIVDGSGRPIVPEPDMGPANAQGTGSVANDGRLRGLEIIASDGITQYPESIVATRSQDTLLFESPTMRFMYEQPEGPETVRMGIWAYTGTITRYAGSSAKRLQITAA